MPADVLAPKVASAPAGMVLAVKEKQLVLLLQIKYSSLYLIQDTCEYIFCNL